MIYRNHWEIELTNHAIIQAKRRGVSPDMILATIKGGKIERFGKRMIRFVSFYKNTCLICIGEIKEMNKIKILTIEWGYM